MPPMADFACLSKKCKTDAGESTVYELPLGAQRCPMCGSKRLTRLFNSAPMVISNLENKRAHFNDVIRPGLDNAEATKLREAPQNADDWRHRRQVVNFAVKPEHFGQKMASLGMNPALAAGWGERVGGAVKNKIKEGAGAAVDPMLRGPGYGTNIIATDKG